MRADRAILRPPASQADRARLHAWQDGTALDGLNLDDARRPRLLDAVHRLFPATSDSPSMSRRPRGFDDPDYADRYFVFGPTEHEASDAELLALLRDWATSGEPSGLLAVAFDPNPDDRRACAHSASVIRRLAGLVGQLGPGEAAPLLPAAVDRLPLPVGYYQLLGQPAAAMETLLSRLVAAADDPGAAELVEAAYRRGMRGFLSFLNAVPRPSHGDPSWRARLAMSAAERGWRAFVEEVEAGDGAVRDNASPWLFRRIERLIGTVAANRLLQEAVDAGVDLPDLASRFVLVDDSDEDIGPVIREFAAGDFMDRIGPDRLREHAAELELQPSDEPGPPGDVSWSDRRRHAKLELAGVLGSLSDRVPALPDVQDPFGTGRRVRVLDASSSEAPALQITVSVLMPAGDRVPDSEALAPGPVGKEREQILRDHLNASALSDWLRRAAAAEWPIEFATGWRISDPGDGRRVTQLAADPPRETGVNAPRPVLAGALVRTGSETGRPFLVADFSVGLWLAELDAGRRPSEARYQERPLPAALDLTELHTLLVTLVNTALTSSRALYRALMTGSVTVSSATVKIAAEAPDGIDAVINLKQLDRVGRGTGSTGQQAVFGGQNTRANLADADVEAHEWALAFTGEWLMRSGYRGYDDSLQKSSVR